MGISAKLLGEDEHVVRSTRTHWKALIVPVLVLLAVVGVGSFLAAVVPDGDLRTPARIGIATVGGALLAGFFLKPFLDWYFATYTLTNRRLITRRGILTRSGRDIPLMRINDVSYEHGIVDRMLGCGTLVIESAGERGQVVLPDVPHVERMHLQMSDLLFGGREGRLGDGLIEGEDIPPRTKQVSPRDQEQVTEEDGATLFSSDDRPDR
jgi:membrane protein YdbS with pleckstrin-like domain